MKWFATVLILVAGLFAVFMTELEAAENWANRMLFPLVAAGLLGWGVARIARRKKPTT